MKSTYYFKVQSIPGTNILCLSPVSLYFQLSISSLSTSTFCMYVQLLSLVQVFGTPLTVGLPGSSLHWIFQQEYWSRLPFPSPEDLPYPGTEPSSCVSCIGRWILYHCTTWEAPRKLEVIVIKKRVILIQNSFI